MKEITMMILNDCPHCKRAAKMIEALKEKHPEISSQFDYYYVPSMFIDGQKLHEGVPSFEAVEAVLKAALA